MAKPKDERELVYASPMQALWRFWALFCAWWTGHGPVPALVHVFIVGEWITGLVLKLPLWEVE